MRPELPLVGAAITVFGAMLVGAAVVPSIVATPDREDVRPAKLDIRETTLSAGAVGGQTATLSLTTYLRHAGGPAENVTLRYRTVDLDTGLVTTSARRDLGTVAGDREVSVTENLTVERQGGYRVETLVYVDGERRTTATREVRGVGTLQPDYARTPLAFHVFAGADLPPIEYRVRSVRNNRSRLNVSAYLTNTGSEPAGDLRLVLTARQADSNIVADRAAIQLDGIAPGRTATPGATLTVPTGYNYYLDAVLWKDGVVVASQRAAANLDPTRTISVNHTREEVGLEVSDFTADDDSRGPGDTQRTPVDAGGQPGFGPAAALAALAAGVLLLSRRWSA